MNSVVNNLTLFDYCLEKEVTFDFDLPGSFRDDHRESLSRHSRLQNKAILGAKVMKLIKTLLVLKNAKTFMQSKETLINRNWVQILYKKSSRLLAVSVLIQAQYTFFIRI